MTAREAFKAVPESQRLIIGDNYFAFLRWESTTGSGGQETPLLISVTGDQAIEIRTDGVFKSSFPADADGYFPYLDKLKKPRKDQLGKLMTQLFEQVAS